MDIERKSHHHQLGIEYARRAFFRWVDIERERTARYFADRDAVAIERGYQLGVSDIEQSDDIERDARRVVDIERVALHPSAPFAPRPFVWTDYVRMFHDRGRVIAEDWREFIPPTAPLARSEWSPITSADVSRATMRYQRRLEACKVVAKPFARKRGVLATNARRAVVLAERATVRASRVTLVARRPVEHIEWARVPSLRAAWERHAATLVRPASDVMLATTFDPMGIHPWSLAIQRAGSELLVGSGDRTMLPDVYAPRRGRFVTAPDHVAFKGTPRYQLPQPCRYFGTTRLADGTVSNRGLGDEPARVETVHGPTGRTVIEYLVMPNGASNRGRVRVAWRGHRKITLTLATRSGPVPIERVATSSARKARGAAVKGPNVNAWDRGAANLGATITARDLGDTVALIESIIRTSSEEHPLVMSDGTTITLCDSSSSVTHDITGRTYGVREFARRAALAGIGIE